MNIKTILFDLGNVLLNFSHQRMCQQVADLFDVSDTDVKKVLFDEGLSLQFETGELTEEQIHFHLEKAFQKKCLIDDLKLAVGNIFTSKPEMKQVVKELKRQGLRLVLLSNTCETHINWIKKFDDILESFDHLILSYKVGACKPSDEIFKAALGNINCEPVECLYTDDIVEYMQAAKMYGFHAEVFTTSDKFIRDLANYGITLEIE